MTLSSRLKRFLKAIAGKDTIPDPESPIEVLLGDIAARINRLEAGSGSDSGNGLITLNLDEANVLTEEQVTAFRNSVFDAGNNMFDSISSRLDTLSSIIAYMVSDNIPDLIEFADDLNGLSGQGRGYLINRFSYQFHAIPEEALSEEALSELPSNYYCLSEDVGVTIAIYTSKKQFDGNEYVKAIDPTDRFYPCTIVFLDKYPAMVPGLADPEN